MRNVLKRLLKTCGVDHGIAAIEFAVTAPLMVTLIVGVFDISKAMILWQQVCNAAHTIPVSASTLSEQPDKSTSLTVTQAQQAMSTIYAEIPWIRDGIETGIRSVTLTSVTFAPLAGCVPSPSVVCTYSANVVWSVSYLGGPSGPNHFQTTVVRPCGVLTQLAPTDPIPLGQTLLTTIRTKNVTAPTPILIADVHYQYTPHFLRFVTGPVDFWETGYWPVRTINPTISAVNQYTKYDIANPSDPANCPNTWS